MKELYPDLYINQLLIKNKSLINL